MITITATIDNHQGVTIAENLRDHYWPGSVATIKLPLRRTLVQLGILLS
jgi:hypothetical protein